MNSKNYILVNKKRNQEKQKILDKLKWYTAYQTLWDHFSEASIHQ